ncbi:DEAD/DEAH box helicase [Planotetraspora mira]|uniref:Helicase ATP-binding domain-containing protein n=1 Tax=Planotetraspora mira TaxID=58121 RepID=A0A8J3XB17_9ACTN|nr:DEAD/DEAH box helicase [Planotetraspora mira]GII34146.1 hypothetical protein Pmi06nite_75880 [Planotetraspora mira]
MTRLDYEGLDAFGAFDAMRDAYLRYYDTAFRLRDKRLQDERRNLLDRAGGVYAEPYIELRPEYASSGRTLAESVADAGAVPELAEFAELGLLPRGRELYTHQEQALRHSMMAGRNVVVTAGTGSGKTEAFLLPILADLLAESREWSGTPASLRQWWNRPSSPFEAQRSGETGRAQAVRALILYPMNALVDDQLVRLRRALDSDQIRAWLDANRGGHRFYFGRFTGATPVTGSQDQKYNVDELRKYLQATEARSERAHESGDEDTRYFVPRLGGAEMVSRWDMHDAPPDILITNHSMLNVMLLRDRDQHFFERTSEWLARNPEARFTLVVDELHMHRGTAGTEVAYLIRNLRHRLGIIDKPEKLRVVATSASLQDDREQDRRFLQEFFAVAEDTFHFIPGEAAKRKRVDSTDLSAHAVQLADVAEKEISADDAVRLLEDTGAGEVLYSALRRDQEGPSSPALPASELAERMFPSASPDLRAAALMGATSAIRAAGEAEELPKIRIHLFFRNVAGIWACCSPSCEAIPGGQYEGRTVGRLYTAPRSQCECGARVLELLYCQACGDVMLGGYAPRSAFNRNSFNSYLLPDTPDLSRIPDQFRQDRTASNYIVYWPSTGPQQADDDAQWTAEAKSVTFTFRRSVLSPKTGHLKNREPGATGWSFHIRGIIDRQTGEPRVNAEGLPPFPTRCPSCSADWEKQVTRGRDGKPKRLALGDPARLRSPIRAMRTGFEKINQVLSTELVGQFTDPGQRKLIVFTDSRQDAAKLAAGLALRHYQDLVRLLALQELASSAVTAEDIEQARAFHQGDHTVGNKAAFERLKQRDKDTLKTLRLAWLDEDERGVAAASAKFTEPPTLEYLAKILVHRRLLALGTNPAGTRQSVQRQGGGPWYELYDWNTEEPELLHGITAAQREAAFSAEEDLLENTVAALFSGTNRDFESLGLGWIEAASAAPTKIPGLGAASLRILAEQHRFVLIRDEAPKPPKRLREYWKKVAAATSVELDDVQVQVEAYWRGIVQGYLIDPRKVVIRPNGSHAWVCLSCQRQHLTPSAGICTACGRPLPPDPVNVSAPEADYYAWKAAAGDGDFRLNCAELTGQTGRIEAQTRQARFQKVFLSEEEESLVHEIDVLSVTTTMEAGVDIGPLSAVVMANMPPTRFNYQQRVGRAGRRSSPVAVALTVCRGRSHDEHYFRHPEAVTNNPTPPPYLAMGRPEILQRAVASDLLRLAFNASEDHGGTSNVHGQFGLAEHWAEAAPEIRQWLLDNPEVVQETKSALTTLTAFPANTPHLNNAWLISVLDRIDEAATAVGESLELSERLAHMGILPMFGFPTRVRQLYLQEPRKRYPWPPDEAVDRDVALAVSQFAPRSEIVKDNEVYTVVGVTEFEPRPQGPVAIEEPLTKQRRIGLCSNCNHLAVDPAPSTEACTLCGVEGFRIVDLREPAGFRAGAPRDFDGNFSWSPRTVSARATTKLDELKHEPWKAGAFLSGLGSRYVVNDNNEKSFSFQRARGSWGGYVEAGAQGIDDMARGSGEYFSVALGAVLPTDFLFVGPQSPVDQGFGYRLNLESHKPFCGADISQGRRAAWYSLAFLIRSAAAAYLDVHPQELIAGVHPGPHNEGTALYAFIADALENGAGFSTHLGNADVIPDFTEYVKGYINSLAESKHAGNCTASCYDCLRDYSNMAFHPLLDWRLASDLFTVLSDGNVQHQHEREQKAVQALKEIYEGTLLAADTTVVGVKARGQRCAVVVKHPLEACEQDLVSPRLTSAIAAAMNYTGDASRIVTSDWFTLEKSPLVIIDQLAQQSQR